MTECLQKRIIAGPCAAESEQQLLTEAKALKELGIKVFRAGIWKPRSRFGTFEGVGKPGLEWLLTVKRETGMATATEVATPLHVELALAHDVDILWIGARTTTNPFAVQDIADSLRGTEIEVLVKNPLSPDLDLWTGAIDRLRHAGNLTLSAVHRGFPRYLKSIYRNDPIWDIPVKLRGRMPEMPLICDPSHIAGCRELIAPVAQHALDLDFDGLIIESHPNPECALSDANQQLTPADLKTLLENLTLRHHKTADETLDHYRTMIDECDDSLIEILKRRMAISDKIGEYKQSHAISVLQTERFNDILQRRLTQAEAEGLNKEFIRHIFDTIHSESISRQTK